MADTLVIGGTGYVGRIVASALKAGGVAVTTTSRRSERADLKVESGADLDRVLERRRFDQIVHLPQLTDAGAGWALDRVDGPRWLVFSSAQLTSQVPSPGNELAVAREGAALDRGATVLRPTMIFGRAGDLNISRMIRFMRRYRFALVLGAGRTVVQPVHVDDIASLVAAHAARPASGLFPVGGDCQLTMGELVDRLRRTLGVRLPALRVPSKLLRPLSRVPVVGVRRDQLLRLDEDKVVDTAVTCESFAWSPRPLAERLAEAVASVDSGGGMAGSHGRITSA